MLRELSDRQLDVKEFLAGLRQQEDKTIEEALAGSDGYDDDTIIDLVLIRLEMSQDPTRDIQTLDLVWAGEFLDHLDTLGRKIIRK